MFPSDNIWNTPVNNLPVDPHSADWVNSIGPGTGLHMDFGSGTWDGGPIGIPYNLSDSTTPKYTVNFLYSDESDPGPYPIPASPAIEYGSDHHLLVMDQSACNLYEMWDASSGGTWSAGSGAIWDLNSDALRPAGWTSSDAAGLPLLPGLVRYDELASGHIDHTIRFTANSTDSYIWPARHLTSGIPGAITSTPPMGARFRLKASFDISGYPAQLQVLLQAMKTYGIILADNGSDWYISGAPDERWNNDTLHLLDPITGDNFEAVDTSGLMVNPDSGAVITSIFGDVPWRYWANSSVERLYKDGISGGCSTNPLLYCPDQPVTRAQMAVFLDRGLHGSSFSPPTVPITFGDTTGNFARYWIEALLSDGITTGCGGGNYCPNASVTRAQMAIFLLKAEHGSTYLPPAPSGTKFTDVSINYWAARWIEQLANEGITSGCGGGSYCPESSVTRAQMAVFLVSTFSLP